MTNLTISTFPFLDGNATLRTALAGTDGTNYAFGHVTLSPSGAIVPPATQPSTALLPQTLTRPANTTAYTALNNNIGALVCPTGGPAYLTFASAASTAGSGVLFGSKLTRSNATQVAGITFRTHIFLAAPTISGAVDNLAYNPHLANDNIYLAFIDHTVPIFGNDCAISFAQFPNGPIPYKIASGSSLFSVIEVRAPSGYTPISAETFTQTLTLSID